MDKLKNAKNKNIPKTQINKSPKSNPTRKRYKLKPELKLFFYALFVSTIFIILSFTILFKIDNISVTGCHVYPVEEIISGSGIEKGESLLLCDKTSAAKNICNKFPYIEDVVVDKIFPSRINIIVQKADEDYVIESENRYLFISKKRKILKNTSEKPENILIVTSKKLKSYKDCDELKYENENTEEAFLAIRESIEKTNIKDIKSINLSNLDDITLNYDNRIDISVGNSKDLDYKLVTAKEIIENKISKLEKGKLDVSSVKEDTRSYFNSYNM